MGFGLMSLNLRSAMSEQIVSTCMVPTVKHGGGEGVWRCRAVTLNRRGYRSSTPSHLVYFSTGQ